MLVRTGRNWNPHTPLAGLQNGPVALENSLVALQKVKHEVTLWLSNSIPMYILKRNKNMSIQKPIDKCSQKHYSSNSQKVKATLVPLTDEWTKKKNVVYPYNEVLFSHKKKWSIHTCYNIDQPWKHCAKWKKPVMLRPYFMWICFYVQTNS